MVAPADSRQRVPEMFPGIESRSPPPDEKDGRRRPGSGPGAGVGRTLRRAGSGMGSGASRTRACSPQPGCRARNAAGRRQRTLTCNRPRVSYRIQAFFWNPGGVDTGSRVRLLGLGSRIWVPGEGCVEQEADSSWIRGRLTGAEETSIPITAGSSIAMRGRSLGRADSNDPESSQVHSRGQI
jgi:hypothetical protein